MLQRNGHYSNGKQRWFCPYCRRSLGWHNPSAKHAKEREWFRRWIVEGYSVRQLSSQSKHSPAKLYRMINYYLEQAPPPAGLGLAQCQHFVLDGTFLHRPRSLIALMDANSHVVVASQYPISESSIPWLEAFFHHLMNKGLCPRSFTVDGNPKVMSVLRKFWPEVVIQRCLVHIQRQGLAWCRASPKTSYARKLRNIFLGVTSITTQANRDKFIEDVTDWERQYGYHIDHRPERGRVFSDIKRARSMLLRALPDMFHYIDDSQIPFSTNGLESYFSRLKSHYRQHRGLSKEKLSSYLNWYNYYVPK
jgi:hypothetical protein